MTKRFIAAAAIVFSLSSCSSTVNAEAPEDVVEVTGEESRERTTRAGDDEFIQELLEKHPDLKYSSLEAKERALLLSDATCDALDAGATPFEVIEMVSESSSHSTVDAMGSIVGLGIKHKCPQFIADFEEYAKKGNW